MLLFFGMSCMDHVKMASVFVVVVDDVVVLVVCFLDLERKVKPVCCVTVTINSPVFEWAVI